MLLNPGYLNLNCNHNIFRKATFRPFVVSLGQCNSWILIIFCPGKCTIIFRNWLKTIAMKKLMLLTILIYLFIAPAFSQIKGHFKIDTTFKDRLRFSYQNPIRFGDSIKLNFPHKGLTDNKRFRFPEYSGRNLVIRPDLMGSIVESQSYDRMPCYIPMGNFPMMVLKPDSTIKHTLLIKRY